MKVIEDFVDEESELQTIVLESVIKYIAGIMIQSTFFLAMDQYSDNLGYKSIYAVYNTQDPMSYVEAAYLVIVSFSTIGYGDIFPCLWVKIFHILVYKNDSGSYPLFQSFDHQ